MSEAFVTLAAYHVPVEAELAQAGWKRKGSRLF